MNVYTQGSWIGPYQVVDVLPGESGGMAATFLARPHQDMAPPTPVVLKLAHGEHLTFLHNEVSWMQQLSHQHILRLLPIVGTGTNSIDPLFLASVDSQTPNAPQYFVTQYMAGGSLEQFLQTRSRLSCTEAIEIATQLAEGLAYLHTMNLVHLDIKPSNLLFRTSLSRWKKRVPDLVISDFGTACPVGHPANQHIAGHPLYTAPERFTGVPPHPQNDIFSFGVVLYRMVTGQHPFEGSVIPGTPLDPQKYPSALNPALNPHLEQIIVRALATDPADRYDSIPSILQDLNAIPHIERPGMVKRPLLHGAYEYMVASLISLAVLILVSIVVVLVFFIIRPSSEKTGFVPTSSLALLLYWPYILRAAHVRVPCALPIRK
jgi:serine/threonine protein kinase